MDYSIAVGTYVKRFDKYFKPIIKQIKSLRPSSEIIVFVNGQLKESFDQQYRRDIIKFCADYENIFPIVSPQGRGFSKLVNSCLLNASSHNVLVLNDDLTIKSERFFQEFEKIIKFSNSCFKINNSWSHVFLNRQEAYEVGWMDERYLGFGEEDGDFEWRYQEKFNKPFPSFSIPDVINHVEHGDYSEKMELINKKYSAFNNKFAFGHKYKEDVNGKNFGIMNRNLICINETKNQYPNEKFYWLNRDKV